MVDKPSEMVRLSVAAKRLGISKTTAYNLIRRGQWPTPLIRIGNRYLVPCAQLDRVLSGEVAQ